MLFCSMSGERKRGTMNLKVPKKLCHSPREAGTPFRDSVSGAKNPQEFEPMAQALGRPFTEFILTGVAVSKGSG
jgi:hypothetical protein